MKKLIAILVTLFLMLTGLTAIAEDGASAVICPASCTKTNFVDADHDGVCDNCSLQQDSHCQHGACSIDDDGDGVCDSCSLQQSNRSHRSNHSNRSNHNRHSSSGHSSHSANHRGH